MVFVLHSGTIQPKAESYLKLTRLSGIIFPYLLKLIKHNKLNTALLHEIVTTFSPFYLSNTTVINQFNQFKDRAIKTSSICKNHSMIYRSYRFIDFFLPIKSPNINYIYQLLKILFKYLFLHFTKSVYLLLNGS